MKNYYYPRRTLIITESPSCPEQVLGFCKEKKTGDDLIDMWEHEKKARDKVGPLCSKQR